MPLQLTKKNMAVGGVGLIVLLTGIGLFMLPSTDDTAPSVESAPPIASFGIPRGQPPEEFKVVFYSKGQGGAVTIREVVTKGKPRLDWSKVKVEGAPRVVGEVLEQRLRRYQARKRVRTTGRTP